MCPGRERAEVERKCKVFEHPIAKGAELVAARVWHEPFDELRLPSLTLWRSHEAAGRVLAAAEPKSRRTRWRHKSIPVVTPADVRMSPSSTKRRLGNTSILG
jgi:hypothetical protein